MFRKKFRVISITLLLFAFIGVFVNKFFASDLLKLDHSITRDYDQEIMDIVNFKQTFYVYVNVACQDEKLKKDLITEMHNQLSALPDVNIVHKKEADYILLFMAIPHVSEPFDKKTEDMSLSVIRLRQLNYDTGKLYNYPDYSLFSNLKKDNIQQVCNTVIDQFNTEELDVVRNLWKTHKNNN